MKKIGLYIVFFVVTTGYTQVLDSISLSQQKMYKSLAETNVVHPDSVFRLTIKEKKIKNLGETLLKYSNLQELHLSGIKLKTLPIEVCYLTNLTILDVSNNKIDSLPEEIGNLKNLTRLSVNRNYLIFLPSSIKELKKLTFLDLWNNYIIEFPSEISALQKTLQTVDMRVIYMSDLRQEELQKLLPKTTFLFSRSCGCSD
jgi:Leucine-rich repeat (LRR) protein